ncbi:MAG TPA: YbjN domain-containing protein [Leptolyngbyaceae cyanobacterium]
MQDDNQGEVAHSLAKYRNHLEFNGYRVEDEEEDFLFCRHPRKVNLCLKKIADRGVLVSTLYSVEETVSRAELLEYANDLNTDFLFMKAYLDEDGLMHFETFFEGDYDRTNFSLLLENIEFDINNILSGNELTEAYLQ